MNNELLNVNKNYVSTNDYEKDIKEIVKSTRNLAYQAVNVALIQRNWLIGKRIYEEELKGENRAKYGAMIIRKLAISLTEEFGKGFGRSNLYQFYLFYTKYKNIFHSPSGQFTFLCWTHYRILIYIDDHRAREWYENECKTQNWSARMLKRNVESQYYYRLLKTGKLITDENIKEISYEEDKYEFIKTSVYFEFLDIPQDASIHESDLEAALITHLKDTLLELGKGYAFVGRQYHIHTQRKDYYIDLVFYNYILKCFVLIDLKTRAITHNDVGQMDMYVRMFDELKKDKSDNPTLGIVLCSETDEDIAKYSILSDSDQLFATKYRLYLPSEEEIKAEIERQKYLFYQSHINDEGE